VKTSSTDFAQFIRQKISEPITFEPDYSPKTDFQKDLFHWLKEETSEADLLITNITCEQYCDRYFLKTDAECAYLDCVYNGKGIYTSLRPYSTRGEMDVKLQSFLNRIV
ncbi:MAG: hypothetical protein IH591_16815, partial [Bacteroidales bacterium]|nr:hypothetical protein [Bacteroidales bacterium]